MYQSYRSHIIVGEELELVSSSKIMKVHVTKKAYNTILARCKRRSCINESSVNG